MTLDSIFNLALLLSRSSVIFDRDQLLIRFNTQNDRSGELQFDTAQFSMQYLHKIILHESFVFKFHTHFQN